MAKDTNSVAIAALDANVKNLGREFGEMKGDVRTTRETVSRIELALAGMPTKEEFKAIEDRVRVLEDDKVKVVSSWKTIAAIASIVGTVVGMVISYFSK